MSTMSWASDESIEMGKNIKRHPSSAIRRML